MDIHNGSFVDKRLNDYLTYPMDSHLDSFLNKTSYGYFVHILDI